MKVQYTDIISISKIKEVYRTIYKNTEHKNKLIRFELTYTSNITKIYNTLNNRHYNHLRYNIFLIKRPKYRIIMSELMYDKIINHLVSKYILIPSLIPKLIEQNVATRKEKGSKAGLTYLKKYINSMKENHDNIYILKCDISKYFYNINHEILLSKLKQDIKDPELLIILKNIIESTDAPYINELITRAIKKEYLNLKEKNSPILKQASNQLSQLPTYIKGKGLPIGNETSQLFAIYYLNDLDHYIKEQLHIKYYIRYMDDFILLHHDKDFLKECLKKIKKEVEKLDLTLNKKTQIYNLKSGCNFLGYKFILKNKKLLVLLQNQTKKRIKRKLKKLKVKDEFAYQKSLASYKGYFMVASTQGFLHKSKLK